MLRGFWPIFFNMAGRGFIWGAGVGLFTGFCLGLPIFIIGGLIGLIWGIGIGARVGFITGLLLATLTFRFFHPLKIEQQLVYQQMTRILCPLIAAMITLLHLWGNSSFYLSLLPALIAGLCAIPLGQHLSNWYLTRSSKHS